MKQEEKSLRENIRHLIKHVKQQKHVEENKLRLVIQEFAKQELKEMIKESSVPDVDPVPNKSTGINVLEELLKKIIPVLETDYKSLTTNPEQRDSFRSHIVNAVVNTLTPAKVNTAAGDEESETLAEIEMGEEIDITVGSPDETDDKFIDIRTDSEKASDDEEEEEDPRADFGSGVDGDETGRNVAYQCFKKIEGSIIDSYELLSDSEDQELFYEYLIANLKLYFDKFEGELSSAVEEPTNQAYDMAKSDAEMQTDEEDVELDF